MIPGVPAGTITARPPACRGRRCEAVAESGFGSELRRRHSAPGVRLSRRDLSGPGPCRPGSPFSEASRSRSCLGHGASAAAGHDCPGPAGVRPAGTRIGFPYPHPLEPPRSRIPHSKRHGTAVRLGRRSQGGVGPGSSRRMAGTRIEGGGSTSSGRWQCARAPFRAPLSR